MNRNLEAGFHGLCVEHDVEAVVVAADAAVTRLVRIVVQEARASRPQRAVVIGFDGSCDQHAVAIGVRALCDPLAHQVLVAQRQHGVNADGEFAVCFEFLEHLHLARIQTGLVDSGVTVRRHAVEPEQDLFGQRLRRWLRHGRAQHVDGLVQEQAGRFAVFSHAHLSADRHRRVRADAGPIERHLVTPAGKAVQAVHQDRVIGDFLCQQGLVGIPVRPRAFVPAAAHDPLALRHGFRAFDDHLDGGFLGVDTDQVDLVEQRPEPEDVRVRIDQSRDYRGTSEVDDPGRVALELHCVDAAADEQDLAVPDRDSLGIGIPAGRVPGRLRAGGAVGTGLFPVECVHAAIHQYQAGFR